MDKIEVMKQALFKPPLTFFFFFLDALDVMTHQTDSKIKRFQICITLLPAY